MRVYGTLLWKELREQVIERDGYQCTKCHTFQGLEVHHKIPLKLGGQNILENLVTLCSSCHQKAEHKVQCWSNGSRKRIAMYPIPKEELATATKSGTGAHVTVPKAWLDKRVYVKLVEDGKE